MSVKRHQCIRCINRNRMELCKTKDKFKLRHCEYFFPRIPKKEDTNHENNINP